MIVKPIGNGGVDALENGEVMAGLQQRGKMGYSAGYGFGTLGKTRFGEVRRVGGIYQKRRYGRKTLFVKMRSYSPTNPQTTEQQARRSVFADAVQAWADLTTEQKNAYNKRATKQGKIGRAVYISEYMKSH